MTQVQQQQNGEITLLAIGGNAPSHSGEPFKVVQAAIDAIKACWGAVQISRFYQTPAFPAGAGPDFVNAACVFYTNDSARDVLDTLHEIEADFGRERTKRWGQRTLDIDLIGQGDSILPDVATFERWYDLPLEDQLTSSPEMIILPHPRVQDRSFVLVPLADVAPYWTHPRLGLTTLQMLNARPMEERHTVIPLIP
ncbi:2-amino-4-hydroxy-6-hydroxymethyldihydropteridine diphosphokinase [Octadecabacter sp.]|nr:2-amino-4-hydroxy-6-hydroxymethyldihydropteridine diphosphokinase [Octadecabacter sp.]